MNDRGVIKWAEVRKALEHAQRNQVQPRLQANMGIVQNPLPNHPPAQAQVSQPPPQPAGGQVPPPVAQPPPPQENVLRINTMIPVGPRQLVTRVQTWSFDGELSISSTQPIHFSHDLTVPPVIYLIEPEFEAPLIQLDSPSTEVVPHPILVSSPLENLELMAATPTVQPSFSILDPQPPAVVVPTVQPPFAIIDSRPPVVVTPMVQPSFAI